MNKIPETRDEWIAYGNRKAGAKKRRVEVFDIPLSKIEFMWDYSYQAKLIVADKHNDAKLVKVLASNSLINLKKEIKKQKWKLAWITTNSGSLSFGQNAVSEYLYVPVYKK